MPPTRTRFAAHRRGSISMLGALLISSVGLLLCFAVQLSDLYLVQIQTQRAADLAALAGAVGASPVITSGAANTAAVASAKNVATANGFGSATVNTTGAAAGAGYTLTTTISSSPTSLTGYWSDGVAPTVGATSQISMVPTTVPDCAATFGGTFSVSGSAALSATGCGVASPSTIAISGGSITASTFAVGVNAYQELPQETGGSTTPTYTGYMYNAQTLDTVATNSSVVAAKAHLASLATWPYGATIPQTATMQTVPAGTAESVSNTTVTVPANTHAGAATITSSTVNFAGSGGPDLNCTSPTTVSGPMQINGSNTLNFASGCYIFNGTVTTDSSSSTTNFYVNSGATVVFYFQGAITNNYTGSLNIGNAYLSAFFGNIYQNNNGTFTVGTGTKIFVNDTIMASYGIMSFGDGKSYFNGSNILVGNYSNKVTFGNGAFYMWNGSINVLGNQQTNFGTGPYYFYNSTITDGQAGQGGLNFAGGNYYFYGGSITTGQNYFTSTTFSAGNMDLYNGASITVQSTTYLGNGSYGPFTTGGTTVSLYGGSVTVTAGSLSIGGGTLAMTTGALSVSGSGRLGILSPTSTTPTYGYHDLAILSTGTDIDFSAGTASIGGMIYAPNNTVALSNAAVLQRASYFSQNWCVSIAASSVTLSGSSTASLYPCTGVTQTTTGTATTLSQ